MTKVKVKRLLVKRPQVIKTLKLGEAMPLAASLHQVQNDNLPNQTLTQQNLDAVVVQYGLGAPRFVGSTVGHLGHLGQGPRGYENLEQGGKLTSFHFDLFCSGKNFEYMRQIFLFETF